MAMSIHTGLLLTILLCTQTRLILTNGEPLKIGAFNIQLFGRTKVGKPEVVGILVKILARYDLVLIQEIRDKSGEAIVELLESLNSVSSDEYQMVISGRVGRTSSKEQYAYFYKSDRLEVTDQYEYDDGDEDLEEDEFEREPYIVRFKSPKTIVKDFVMVGIHTKPTDAYAEIDSLADVYDDITEKWGIEDVVIAGDFNAGCLYVKNWDDNNRLKDDRFHWLLDDDADTNLASSSQCAYDRFVVAGDTLLEGIKPCSAKVFYFSAIYGLDYEFAKDVSDHFPIEFQLLEDHRYMENLEEEKARFVKFLLNELNKN